VLRLLAEAHHVEQVTRVLAKPGFVFGVRARAKHGRQHAGLMQVMARDHDVFFDRHRAEQPDVLKRARDAAMGDACR
jgi:hypothetical protein